MGVARLCVELAKEMGWSEDRQRQAFLMGWNHDIGYEFCSCPEEHAFAGANIIRSSLGWWPEIKYHGLPKSHSLRIHNGKPYESEMLDVLNTADILTASNGEQCTAYERLKELESRGIQKESEKY